VILRRQKSSVSKTAARPTDHECSSVGRTQLSDTGVSDELTVVGQVTQAIAGQEPVESNLEHDALPHSAQEAMQRSQRSTGEI